jgi:hypothetical protein
MITPDLAAEGRAIARKLQQTRDRQEAVKESAKDWAHRAHDAGGTEVEMAAILNVDRAKTLRPWLGKPRRG